MNDSISRKIRERINCIEVGKLFVINDFEDVDHDSLVTRILSRMQRESIIIRVNLCGF